MEVDPRTTRCAGSSACTPRAITVLHVPLRPKSATPPMRGSTAASRSAAFAGSWFTTREKGNAGRSERTPSGSSSPPSGSEAPRVVAATSGARRRGTRDRVERYARDNGGRVASIIAAVRACSNTNESTNESLTLISKGRMSSRGSRPSRLIRTSPRRCWDPRGTAPGTSRSSPAARPVYSRTPVGSTAPCGESPSPSAPP